MSIFDLKDKSWNKKKERCEMALTQRSYGENIEFYLVPPSDKLFLWIYNLKV